jgi:hypothetical protein
MSQENEALKLLAAQIEKAKLRSGQSSLETAVYMAIKMAPKAIRKGLSAPYPSESDSAANALTDRVLQTIEAWLLRQADDRPPPAPSSGRHFDQDAASDPAQNKPAG